MKNNSNYKSIKIIIIGIIFTFGMSFVMAEWSDPTCAPPGCNKKVPLNSTSFSQAKIGALVVGDPTPAPTPNTNGYIFSAVGGTSYFEGIKTDKLVFVDNNSQRTGKYLVSNANGVASWREIGKNIATNSFTVSAFSINVPRSKAFAPLGVSQIIPKTYQYCAISQLGPDFANSDNQFSVCSVNQNTDGTWTLFGNRGDDPDFICKAQCFYSAEVPLVIRP